MNIVVLAGGLSTERNVSLTTGAKVQNALIENGHHAILADVFMGYKLDGTVEDEFKNATRRAQVEKVSEIVPDLEKIKKARGTNPDVFFGENIIELCSYADVVYMALHGENGEDGRLQAAFDLLGIKYTGSGYFGCAVSMNKNLTWDQLPHDDNQELLSLEAAEKFDGQYILQKLRCVLRFPAGVVSHGDVVFLISAGGHKINRGGSCQDTHLIEQTGL